MWVCVSTVRLIRGRMAAPSYQSPRTETPVSSRQLISLSFSLSFPQTWRFQRPVASRRPKLSTMVAARPLRKAQISQKALGSGNCRARTRRSTCGRPMATTRPATAWRGPARRANASPARWTAGRPPPCARGGGWRRSTTPLRLCAAAPPPTPTRGSPRWRSYATLSSTSRACRSCSMSRWNVSTACQRRASRNQAAPRPAAQMAW